MFQFRTYTIAGLCACLVASTGFAESKRSPASTTTTTTTATTTDSSHRNIGRRPTSTQEQNVPENLPWWTPEDQKYSIGFEHNIAFIGLFTKNAITAGTWLNDTIGFDIYFGYNKAADTITETTTTTDNVLTNSRTVSTAFGGLKNPHIFTLGAGLKYRVYQNSWFQLNVGPVVAINTPGSATYNSAGARTETIPSLDTPENKVIASTVASTNFKQDLAFMFGPRIATEFYLKWIPHLAIGAASGVLLTVGNGTTSTTTATNRTVQVVNGVELPPTVDNSTTTTVETKPGFNGGTFGLGGTIFSLFGNFIVRYVW